MNRTNSEHRAAQDLRPGEDAMSREDLLNGMYQAAGLPLIDLPSKAQRPRADWSRDPDFPSRVAQGVKLRKTLAPFVPSPLLDMLVLGRIIGTYPDPRGEGKNPAVLHAVTSDAPGGKLREANAGTEFTATPPAWYPGFREANPDYRVHQFIAEQNSKPADSLWGLWHGGDEWSLQTWRDRKTGALDYTLKQGFENHTTADPRRPGYDLLITEHWHPFAYEPKNPFWLFLDHLIDRKLTKPGPSAGPNSDVEAAYKPGMRDGLSIVHALNGDEHFYGPNAGLPK